MFGLSNRKWRKFDKLASAIRMAEQRGAEVTWRGNIGGGCFDAMVLCPYNPNRYLVVVDCIEAEASVTRKQVEDFVVKAKKARAHIAILASSSEFHRDSLDVANEHALRLLTLETINTTSVSVLTQAFDLVLRLYQFRLQTERENDAIGLPEEPGILKYFMNEMRIVGSGIDTVPERLLEAVKDEVLRAATGVPQLFQIPLPKGTVIEHPNTGQGTPVTGFSFVYQLLSACDFPMTDELGTTPYLSETSAEEELAKRNPVADASSIKTGFNTRLRTGKYYYNPQLRFSYLCEKTEKRAATMVLVESYQGGHLIQARIVLSKQQSKQLLEVTEQGEIERLAKMYEKLSISDKDLEGRFKIFAKHIDEAECIDDLTLTAQQAEKQKGKNKADYFFNNREIICELKSLHDDTSWKIENILAPYKETPEWPIIYGTVGLHQVLNHIPDGDIINAKIVEAVTDPLDWVFEQANRQIRDTKAVFDLPNSGGLLIIINDLVDVLSPELIVYRVRKCLQKRTAAGEVRFPEIAAVLVINTTHYLQLNPQLKGMPILPLLTELPGSNKVKDFLDALIPQWAAFEGLPLIESKGDDSLKLGFRKFGDKNRKK